MLFLDIKHDVQASKVLIDGDFIILKLTNGLELKFSKHLNKRLAGASSDQLKKVELICDGTGLHWDELDEDLSVSGILDGRFG